MKIGIQGIRYDAQSSYLRGSADAPARIREALHSASANSWSESGLDLSDVFEDHGDIAPANYDHILPVTQSSPMIYLGGDHSITYPLVRAVAAIHGPLEILHFDAHPDLYDEFEGNRFSHACPFARILENGLASRLVQVGIRTAHGHQRQQAKRFGVEVIEMKAFRDDWIPQFSGPVYVSFDMDGLDPACAPGVSHWEPGGLTTRQALRVIQSLAGNARVVAADIVEFNPSVEEKLTAMTSAKILKELAAAMLTPSQSLQ
jgi:arginase